MWGGTGRDGVKLDGSGQESGLLSFLRLGGGGGGDGGGGEAWLRWGHVGA